MITVEYFRNIEHQINKGEITISKGVELLNAKAKAKSVLTGIRAYLKSDHEVWDTVAVSVVVRWINDFLQDKEMPIDKKGVRDAIAKAQRENQKVDESTKIAALQKKVEELKRDSVKLEDIETAMNDSEYDYWEKYHNLKQQIEELKRDNYSLHDTNDQQKQVIGQLTQPIEELKKYAKHHVDCLGTGNQCTCGLDKLLKTKDDANS